MGGATKKFEVICNVPHPIYKWRNWKRQKLEKGREKLKNLAVTQSTNGEVAFCSQLSETRTYSFSHRATQL